MALTAVEKSPGADASSISSANSLAIRVHVRTKEVFLHIVPHAILQRGKLLVGQRLVRRQAVAYQNWHDDREQEHQRRAPKEYQLGTLGTTMPGCCCCCMIE